MNKINKNSIITISIILISGILQAQTTIDNLLKSSEVLINGLSFLKGSNSKNLELKIINSICIKNKLTDKITYIMIGKDDEEQIVKKELIIQKDGKECVYDIPKGIYAYEIIMPNKDVFKKGEYKFNEETTITVKQD